MIFGDTALSEARGAILAHSLKAGAKLFKKGRFLSPEDIAALRDAGIDSVIAARLEDGDVHEDAAAAALAKAILGNNLSLSAAFTGRSNLLAEKRGILLVERERVNALNAVDEAVTLATLEPYALIEARQLAATVKIIPFAVSGAVLQRCLDTVSGDKEPLLRVVPLRSRQAGLVQTRLPGMKDSLLEKTRKALDGRLAALDCPAVKEVRCGHNPGAVAQAIGELRAQACEIVLVSGASAIVDRRDVVPTGIVEAGGKIEHFGMPVDPGNLILLASLGDTPVVGLPGCARSPKLNGFDWVLQRLIAGVAVTGPDIMAMGAGGLLKEIGQRPLPRAAAVETQDSVKPRLPNIAALVLAAGQSRRMGAQNKLLAQVDGQAMVVRVLESVLSSKVANVLTVTGHQADEVSAAIAGLNTAIVHNPDYAAGLSTSLHRGLGALARDVDGVIVCLGDMPRVGPAAIDALIEAFSPLEDRAICVPTLAGKRGNPVLFATRFAAEIQEIGGDVGARYLLGEYPELVCEVAMDEIAAGAGILEDVDTPEALAALTKPGD